MRETQGSDSSKNLSVFCVLRSTFSGIERSFSSGHIYATFRNISIIYIYIYIYTKIQNVSFLLSSVIKEV